MTLLKRISASLKANVEQVVDQIENQDAVVEAAINDMRRHTAKAKARLVSVSRDREQMQNKLADLEKHQVVWQQRAKDQALKDEETALACLARSKDCASKAQTLQQSLIRQQQAESQLQQDIQKAEDRVAELSRQRHLMRSRQSAADAVKSSQQYQEDSSIDVDAVFERWEGRVLEAEMTVTNLETDPLDYKFSQTEQQSQLKAELQELINKKENSND